MMDLFYPLSLVATTVEMTVCLSCALHLWRMRRESQDRSRRTLALGSLISSLLAMMGILSAIGMQSTGSAPEMLIPWLELVYLSMHIMMTLYPIMVVRPDWLNPRHFFYIFLPILVLPLLYLFFIGHWTPIHTPSDIWYNWSRPDVLARLFCLFIMLPYSFILFLLPYNYHRSSATFRWILHYSLGLLVICVVHIVFTLTNYAPLFIALPLFVSIFFFRSMEYELNDRLIPSHEETAEPEPEPEMEAPVAEPSPSDSFGDKDLWTRIGHLMDKEKVWQDPDLSLVSLARQCATNVTYLNRIIKDNTGSSFKEFVNARRVKAVADALRHQPDTDIQSAFFNAGYRSRATAWRNFKDIMGVTPSEFRQSLK